MESAIYVGTVRHRRYRPVHHEFIYPLFMAFLDIDRLSETMEISPFSAYNRWNWVSYDERDHFGDPDQPLRLRLLQDAAKQGLRLPEGRIFLLTHLRYLGYNFNPVSFFYCYDRMEKLQAILAEVNNTFGETHNYWLTPGNDRSGNKSVKYWFPKAFHVSPFMNMQQEYEWTFTAPSRRLISQSITHENGVAVFDSTLKMDRREWSRAALHRTLAQYPWVTLKVIAAIHWQAVRLFFKRVPVIPHPGTGRFRRANSQHWGASWGTG
jgi:uncharacterized protein